MANTGCLGCAGRWWPVKTLRCAGAGRASSGRPLIAVLGAAVAGGPLLAGALAGCSLVARADGSQVSFQQALARIAATPATRRLIVYDNTGALVKLTGSSWSAQGSFAALRGTGAGPLTQVGQLLASNPGINLLGASYTITAGQQPQQVGLIAGGQQAQRVSTGLAKLGWAPTHGRLVAPSPDSVGGNQQYTSIYALNLAQVRTTGSDVRFGGAQADLGEIDHSTGPTLAVDPGTKALAGCLGNVVAAEVDAAYPGGPATAPGSYSRFPLPSGPAAAVAASPSAAPAPAHAAASPSHPAPAPSHTASPSSSPSPSASGGPAGGPAAVAAGVRRPQSGTSTPQAVVCVAWPTQAAADKYTSELRALLPGGVAPDLGVPYSRLLSRPSVRDIGGSHHLVAWQAGTPANAGAVLQMVQDTTLPALPDCAHLPPQNAAHVTGCT